MTTRFLPALAVFLAAIGFSFYIRDMASGQTLVFALFCGLALGFVFQRSRFCFYCHARDWFEDRNPRGVLSIILAIAIGLIIYTIVLSSWMPNPQGGSFLAKIHFCTSFDYSLHFIYKIVFAASRYSPAILKM